jgi:hypothetical protein
MKGKFFLSLSSKYNNHHLIPLQKPNIAMEPPQPKVASKKRIIGADQLHPEREIMELNELPGSDLILLGLEDLS